MHVDKNGAEAFCERLLMRPGVMPPYLKCLMLNWEDACGAAETGLLGIIPSLQRLPALINLWISRFVPDQADTGVPTSLNVALSKLNNLPIRNIVFLESHVPEYAATLIAACSRLEGLFFTNANWQHGTPPMNWSSMLFLKALDLHYSSIPIHWSGSTESFPPISNLVVTPVADMEATMRLIKVVKSTLKSLTMIIECDIHTLAQHNADIQESLASKCKSSFLESNSSPYYLSGRRFSATLAAFESNFSNM